MVRLAVPACAALAAALLSACGGEDDRPETLEYITSAILIPSCASAQCHSAFAQAEGYDFSSVEATRRTLEQSGAVVPGSSAQSTLFQVLISPGGDGAFPRMPYDRPIPNADIELIERWILSGAEGL